MEATVHEVSNSQTRLSDSHNNSHTLRGKGVSLSLFCVFFFFFFDFCFFLFLKFIYFKLKNNRFLPYIIMNQP